MTPSALDTYTQLLQLRSDYQADLDIGQALAELIDTTESFSWLFSELLLYAIDYGLDATVLADKIDFSSIKPGAIATHVTKNVPNLLDILIGYAQADYLSEELIHPSVARVITELTLHFLQQSELPTTQLLALTTLHRQAKANLPISETDADTPELVKPQTILDVLKDQGIFIKQHQSFAERHTQTNAVLTTTTNKRLFLKTIRKQSIYNKLRLMRALQNEGLSMPRIQGSGQVGPNQWFYVTDYIKATSLGGLSSPKRATQLAKELRTIHNFDATGYIYIPEAEVLDKNRMSSMEELIESHMEKKIFEWIPQFKILFDETKHLLNQRPIQLCHGDFKPANTLYDGKRMYIIDFDNLIMGDPWQHDFAVLNLFERQVSKPFAQQFLKSYFNGHIPEDFYPINRVYSLTAHLSLYDLHVRTNTGHAQTFKEQTDHLAAKILG